mgnify:CR=1 FL=1
MASRSDLSEPLFTVRVDMRERELVAALKDLGVEAQTESLPVADAIVLREAARVKIFLDSDPLNSIEATLVRSSYRARVRESQQLAFRLVAEAAPETQGQEPALQPLPAWPGQKDKAVQFFQLNGYIRGRSYLFHQADLAACRDLAYADHVACAGSRTGNQGQHHRRSTGFAAS